MRMNIEYKEEYKEERNMDLVVMVTIIMMIIMMRPRSLGAPPGPDFYVAALRAGFGPFGPA